MFLYCDASCSSIDFSHVVCLIRFILQCLASHLTYNIHPSKHFKHSEYSQRKPNRTTYTHTHQHSMHSIGRSCKPKRKPNWFPSAKYSVAILSFHQLITIRADIWTEFYWSHHEHWFLSAGLRFIKKRENFVFVPSMSVLQFCVWWIEVLTDFLWIFFGFTKN